MKKFVLAFVLLTIAVALAACAPAPDEDVFFDVAFGGDGVKGYTIKVKEGETVPRPADPAADGMNFLYWADESGEVYDFDAPVSGNVRLFAVWNEVSSPSETYYKVRFFGVDGKQLGETQTVKEGDGATSPYVPVRDFYVFDRWSADFACVTSDLDVYAYERYDACDAELFEYRKEDSEYCLIGLKEGKKLPEMSGGYVKLALPTEYLGLPITSIADGADMKGVFGGLKIYSLYVPSCYKRIGAYAFYDDPALTHVTFNEGLKEIGEGAFMATLGGGTIDGGYAHSGAPAYVSALTSIDIPSSVETIEDYAFAHVGGMFWGGLYMSKQVSLRIARDSKLANIGSHAFEGVMLAEIDLGAVSGALRIGDYAFAADTYLNWVYSGATDKPRSVAVKLVLPQGVSYIGDYAFYGIGCMSSYYNGQFSTKSTAVSFRAPKLTLEYLGDYAFCGAKLTGELSLVTDKIGDHTFFGHNFSRISLGLTRVIDQYAFAQSEGGSVCDLDLGYSTDDIGVGAFKNNTGLRSLSFESELTHIGADAFSGCSGLDGTLRLLESLSEIGDGAFRGCGFDVVEIDGEVDLGAEAFAASDVRIVRGRIGVLGRGVFWNCASLRSVELPAELASLPSMTFAGCVSLDQVTLPDNLRKIGDYSFSGCSSLAFVRLPFGLTELGEGAFEKCGSLTEVDFECGELRTVENSCFAFCSSLAEIRLPDSVEFIGDNAFRGSALVEFRTPASLARMGKRVFCREEYSLDKNTNPQYAPAGGPSVAKVSLPTIKKFVIASETGEIEFSSGGTFDGALVERFEVETGNAVYGSYDGILYDVDKTRVIMYMRDSSRSEIRLPEGLLSVSDGTFYNNPYLKSVVLPSTLQTIGDYAFFGCTELTSLDLPASLTSIGKYAFAGTPSAMSRLSRIDFGEACDLDTIGEGAFEYNRSLTSVAIPASVKSIGDKAFYSDSALSELDLSQATSLETIGYKAFGGDAGMTPTISSVDFSHCAALDSTGSYAFAGCKNLCEIEFGDLGAIDSGSFSGCVGLTAVTIGGRITTIGSDAFRSCTSLKNIIVPTENRLADIMSYAFAGTISKKVNYTDLDLSNATGLRTVDDYAFAYGSVRTVKFPSAPYVLGDDVFDNCSDLASVDLGEGVTTIGENVFRYCYALKELNVPASVTTVLKDAFRGLDLVTVNIGTPRGGNSITSLGKNSFFDCKKLRTVNIYGENIPLLKGGADNLSFHCLAGTDVVTIPNIAFYVDEGMLDLYDQGATSGGWDVYRGSMSERLAA